MNPASQIITHIDPNFIGPVEFVVLVFRAHATVRFAPRAPKPMAAQDLIAATWSQQSGRTFRGSVAHNGSSYHVDDGIAYESFFAPWF